MTPERVSELTSLYEKLDEAENELELFCDKAARSMNEDWKGVESARIINGFVRFTAYWYGSYQAHDSEHFVFPVELLLQSEEKAGEYCKLHRKK